MPLQDYLLERIRRSRLNCTSNASDPGGVALSRSKLRKLSPEYYPSPLNIGAWFDSVCGTRAADIFAISQQLLNGDSRAAIVVSVSPLIVAAYTDELDCVALLKFPNYIAETYALQMNQQLLTVNNYGSGKALASDLQRGERSYDRWTNFRPLIAEFLTDDMQRIEI